MSDQSESEFSAGWSMGLAILVVLLLMTIGAMGTIYLYALINDERDNRNLALINEQRLIVWEISNHSEWGATDSIERLVKNHQRFNEILKTQGNGDPVNDLPPLPDELSPPLENLGKQWDAVSHDLKAVIGGREVYAKLLKAVKLLESMGGEWLKESHQVALLMARSNIDPYSGYLAGYQLHHLQYILHSTHDLLEGYHGSQDLGGKIVSASKAYEQVLVGFLDGNPELSIVKLADPTLRDEVQGLLELYGTYKKTIEVIVGFGGEVERVTAAVQSIKKIDTTLLTQVEQLHSAYFDYIDSRIITQALAIIVGGLAVLLVIFLGAQIRKEAFVWIKRKQQQTEAINEQNHKNQMAIMRLLDEMGDLADGDLTVEAVVTNEITSAIADSINLAIGQMRTLVSAINEAAGHVTNAAQDSQSTAADLTDASEHQVQQIVSVSNDVNQMADSIEGVSHNADKLAGEAHQSVEIAKKGADVVQQSIHGMDAIRGQIQETSKRIKRLGESSQKIGDIVELINDISEQTNILALNAAIQAAMAGEAGRGFAVVADEVQRLAERSGDATKQIEALVKTIQTDTNEAVISMEKSTSGVVEGATLAENAGEALQEIENVASHLEELVQNISGATRQQASAAVKISGSMKVIREITTQTSEGTNKTTADISDLAKLAIELKDSVAGFKLP